MERRQNVNRVLRDGAALCFKRKKKKCSLDTRPGETLLEFRPKTGPSGTAPRCAAPRRSPSARGSGHRCQARCGPQALRRSAVKRSLDCSEGLPESFQISLKRILFPKCIFRHGRPPEVAADVMKGAWQPEARRHAQAAMERRASLR